MKHLFVFTLAALAAGMTNAEDRGTDCLRPFDAEVVSASCTNHAVRCEGRGADRFALAFAGGGEAVFARKAFDWGTRYTLESLDVPGAETFRFGIVRAPWATDRGEFANALVGKDRAVCVRAYDIPAEMFAKDDALWLETTRARGLVGTRFAVVEGPREGFRERLQEMTRDFCEVTGVPLPVNGGAFSQTSEPVRASYFMATPRMDQLDDAIDMALRSGAKILHVKNWWQSIGHYEPSTNLFPRGKADFLEAAERIRRAGLVPGMHSLCVAVGVNDPWVSDGHAVEFKEFDGYVYSLAASIDVCAKELTVREPIRDRHDRTISYLGRGNVLRIGGELLQYSNFDRARRAFTGLTRGAFGTSAAAHAAGDRTDYVEQHFFEFFPRPDSPLVGKVVRSLSDRYREGGFTQFYYDGIEIFDGPSYGNPVRRAMYCGLAAVRPPIIEASGYGPHNWWWHSRTGTWDTPIWGLKRYHDMHLAELARTRRADFLEVGTGWFYPKSSNWQARGFTRDEIEYFAAKNAGRDYPTSAGIGSPFPGRDVPASSIDAFAIIGWYERLREARAFAPGVRERLDNGTGEWRLRQNAAGVWTIRPVTMFAADGRAASATLSGGEPLALRVSPRWDVDPESARTLLKEVGFVSTECPFVRTFDYPHASILPAGVRADTVEGRPAWRFRVKGDGRGGTLRLRLETPREFGGSAADHVVPLDFTGWRTFVCFDRARDVSGSDPLQRYRVYRNPLAPDHIEKITFSVEGGSGRTIEVGALEALTPRATPVGGLAVMVNGDRLVVPFALAGDEYAELEDGLWRKYDGSGLVVGEAPGPRSFACAGENRWAVDGNGRATVQVLGREAPAVATDLSDAQRTALSHEYDFTRVWNPSAGVTRLDPVVIRPGEKARLQVRYVGKPVDPVLTVGGVKLAEGINGQLFSGSNDVRFSCSSSGPIRIEIAKVYDKTK